MINQLKLNQALVTKLKSVVDALAIPGGEADQLKLVVGGDKYKPDPLKSYVMEKEVPTSIEGKLCNGSDIQRGFYQATICTPINDGKFKTLLIADSIRAELPNGRQAGIEKDGQIVTISTVESSGVYSDETHLKVALTIRYTVIA